MDKKTTDNIKLYLRPYRSLQLVCSLHYICNIIVSVKDIKNHKAKY